ncbi:MAG TPA: hypothetical protein VGP76_13075 [Planctomycetaceae bacterium]|jgi:hypothetical protein|nr:hypothetical protein [Planctomycetaceae bacterium]
MSVVNLQEHFGKRYRIDFDPAYDPAHRPKDKLDPWYMVIPCERGTIYPQGGDRLTAEVEGRAPTRRQLQALDCVTVTQEGDSFLAVTFNVSDFGKIAQIIKPRRKRVLSPEQLERLVAMGRTFGFPTHRTTHVSAPGINAEPAA